MKVFISQPMHGLTDEEILNHRRELIEKIKSVLGNDVEIIDSFTKSPELIAKGRIAMLGHSIQLMADADAVVFAIGFNKSIGCWIEHRVAESYHIPMLREARLDWILKKEN